MPVESGIEEYVNGENKTPTRQSFINVFLPQYKDLQNNA